jgi:hypothetical protein
MEMVSVFGRIQIGDNNFFDSALGFGCNPDGIFCPGLS